jgi:hypothetical protein
MTICRLRGAIAIVLALAVIAAVAGLASSPAEAVRRPKVLRVFSTAQLDSSRQGGFNEVEAGMENLTDDRNVVAWTTTTVVYADGRKDTIMRWRRPMILEPRHGFSAFILFLVPKDAPVGKAIIRVTARIVRTAPGEAGEGPRLPYIIATDSFEVKPARGSG